MFRICRLALKRVIVYSVRVASKNVRRKNKRRWEFLSLLTTIYEEILTYTVMTSVYKYADFVDFKNLQQFVKFYERC